MGCNQTQISRAGRYPCVEITSALADAPRAGSTFGRQGKKGKIEREKKEQGKKRRHSRHELNIKSVLAACRSWQARRICEAEVRKVIPATRFDLMFWVDSIKYVGRKFLFLATF